MHAEKVNPPLLPRAHTITVAPPVSGRRSCLHLHHIPGVIRFLSMLTHSNVLGLVFCRCCAGVVVCLVSVLCGALPRVWRTSGVGRMASLWGWGRGVQLLPNCSEGPGRYHAPLSLFLLQNLLPGQRECFHNAFIGKGQNHSPAATSLAWYGQTLAQSSSQK